VRCRYIGQLRQLDVPVEAVRGRFGGYRLASGYRMQSMAGTKLLPR
jgi:predicted DNA-binding transcriptional regulator YafY